MALNASVRAAKSRQEVLEAIRSANTKSVETKFSSYFGEPVKGSAAWDSVIPCLSASAEAFTHAVCDWGVKRVGHENTGNSPSLARRLAFLRGAARQFGAKIVDYQSCNFGDSATMFSRESYLYPASSRYILDNSYDAWAGAGVNWLLKDYFLWHLAGVDAFYNEQGVDIFWKPGGGSAGDNFPVRLSPKGITAEAMITLAHKPRGTQITPVAFLVDEAHGWAQERFQPGAFGLDPALNPSVLTPGRHEASLRGWFDIAYFPAPETQNEPANAVRQTYVNGIFGDIFDVIVNAPKHTIIAKTYRVIIAAGEIGLTEEWGRAVRDNVEAGATLVVTADQLSGPGIKSLGLPEIGRANEASTMLWGPSRIRVPSNVFACFPIKTTSGDEVLAASPDGEAIAVSRKLGKGHIIFISVPLGLGIDERPVPLLSLIMMRVTEGLLPVIVDGDVEWTVSQLDDGGFLVGILNNRGINKPQHGILPTDHAAAATVTLRTGFKVRTSTEWIASAPVSWKASDTGAELRVVIPAGATRLLAVYPAK
jgi:hypothetical protein